MLKPEHSYPLNADGNPEFASVIVTLDHLANRQDHHVVQKMVYSTEDEVEALVAIMRYFDEAHLIGHSSTVKLMAAGQNADMAMYIYATKRGEVEVVMSTPTFASLIAHPDFGKGSSLLACDAIVTTLSKLYAEVQAQTGGEVPPLMLITPELSPRDELHERREQAGDGGTDAKHTVVNEPLDPDLRRAASA